MNRELEKEIEVRKDLLRKLYMKKRFRKGHLLYEHLISCVPSHLRGTAKQVLIQLIRDGLVLHYGRTLHGDAYQLNIERLQEIEEIILEDKNS